MGHVPWTCWIRYGSNSMIPFSSGNHQVTRLCLDKPLHSNWFSTCSLHLQTYQLSAYSKQIKFEVFSINYWYVIYKVHSKLKMSWVFQTNNSIWQLCLTLNGWSPFVSFLLLCQKDLTRRISMHDDNPAQTHIHIYIYLLISCHIIFGTCKSTNTSCLVPTYHAYVH